MRTEQSVATTCDRHMRKNSNHDGKSSSYGRSCGRSEAAFVRHAGASGK